MSCGSEAHCRHARSSSPSPLKSPGGQIGDYALRLYSSPHISTPSARPFLVTVITHYLTQPKDFPTSSHRFEPSLAETPKPCRRYLRDSPPLPLPPLQNPSTHLVPTTSHRSSFKSLCLRPPPHPILQRYRIPSHRLVEHQRMSLYPSLDAWASKTASKSPISLMIAQ